MMTKSAKIHSFRIDLTFYEEGKVYGATSEDIPGLFLSAKTPGGIMDALEEYAPELIESNLRIPLKGEFRFIIVPDESARKARAGAGERPKARELRFPRMEDFTSPAVA